MAFLLWPEDGPAAATALAWAADRRAAGQAVGGLNVCDRTLPRFGGCGWRDLVADAAVLVRSVVEAADGVSWLLIAHDFRGRRFLPDELAFHAAVFAALPAGVRERVALMPKPKRAGEVKRACAALDFVVASRMHLAVAALGAGTPAVGIAYQGKFEGTFAWFGMAHLLISPAEAAAPERLAAFVAEHFADRQVLRRAIRERLPMVMDFAARNFDPFDMPPAA